MNIAVLGTGVVGDTIASKLIELGHSVKMGSRTANNEKAAAWVAKAGGKSSQGTFADAAQSANVIFNCGKGEFTLEVLKQAGIENLKGKILIDLANSFDYSKGMPPQVNTYNGTSLGEEVQKLLPDTKVVKTLNTLNCKVMVNPGLVNGGDHNLFMSGNDAAAKEEVKNLLASFGWIKENIIDLGDISTARGTEQFLPLWMRLYGKFASPMFQIKIVK
ncbi:MAG: NADPH-dependent F420 reductase [Flavobacteriales bacterium]